MQAEIVAIGDEVLAGFTLNTNSAYLSRQLFERGYKITRHMVLPDQHAPLLEGLKRALGRSDLVITTGGLGPTVDDTTRRTIAELTGSELKENGEVLGHLEERFGKGASTLTEQATIPTKAEPLHNPVGTAPGLLFRFEGKLLIALPGVPREMEALLPQVLPHIEAAFPSPPPSALQVLHFFQTPEAKFDAFLRPYSGVGIYPSLGTVTVRLCGPDSLAARDALLKEFGDRSFDSPSGTLQEAVHLACVENGLTVATAESCTGGGVAHHLTQFCGASEFFRGGVAAYCNTVKEKVLGVSSATLETHGAVSEETVGEMTRGVLSLMDADLAVAISGIAGPTGGTEEKPVGTVCFAAQRRGQAPVLSTYLFRGNRASIIQRSIHNALAELLKMTP